MLAHLPGARNIFLKILKICILYLFFASVVAAAAVTVGQGRQVACAVHIITTDYSWYCNHRSTVPSHQRSCGDD